MSKLGSSCSGGRRSATAMWMSRMLMTSCLMCSRQKGGGSVSSETLPSRCTWTGRQDGIWKRAKHIWLDQRRGGREKTRAIMAKEVTGREKTDREQRGGEGCDLQRRKAGKRVCNAEKGVRQVWAVQSSAQKEMWGEIKWLQGKIYSINHRMRKECGSKPFVFSIWTHWMHFFLQTDSTLLLSVLKLMCELPCVTVIIRQVRLIQILI